MFRICNSEVSIAHCCYTRKTEINHEVNKATKLNNKNNTKI